MTTGASEIISIVAVSVGLVSALGNYLYTNHRFKAQNYPVIAYRMDLKHQSRDHACLSLAPLNLHTTVPVQKLSMGIRLARSRRVPLWPWRWRRYHTAAWELVGPAEGCPHECSGPDLDKFVLCAFPRLSREVGRTQPPQNNAVRRCSLDVLVTWTFRPGVYRSKECRGSEKHKLLRCWGTMGDGGGRQYPYWKLEDDE